MILSWVSQRLTLKFQIKPILLIAVHQLSNKKLQKIQQQIGEYEELRDAIINKEHAYRLAIHTSQF